MSTAQPATHQALYRACMKEAAAQGRTLMKRLIARAAEIMPQRAAHAPDMAERTLMTEAVRALMKMESVLCEAYPQALLAEFAQAIAGDTRKAGTLNFDSLELMGDDEVQEGVELVRTQQAVMLAVEAELTQLNALVCAVQGLKSVQVERNPLRPEIYVRALRNMLQDMPIQRTVRTRWLHSLGEAMGPELAQVYRELSSMLRSEGVSEASFKITPMAQSPAVTAAAAADAVRAAELASDEAGQAKVILNVTQLRRLLSGEFDIEGLEEEAAKAVAPDFSMTVPAAFEMLQEMKQVDQVMNTLKKRQAAAPEAATTGSAALREQIRSEARGPGQKLGLEVVHLLIENIAGDDRLLPPVQQTVRDLEPALMRLALTDPRFFSDRKHPARELLEQITERSMAWESVDAPGFAAFLDPLQQAVDALLSTRFGGADPFDFALKTLEEAWRDQQKRDRRHREKAVRTLLAAEQRNLLAERVAQELKARDDFAAAPREIAAFVTGPWAQVIAHARLSDNDGSPDPDGYTGIVSDLISSVQQRPGNAARLAKMVPMLLERLQRGLAGIDYPQQHSQKFFTRLSKLHERAMKPAEERLTRAELDAQFADDETVLGAWLAPSEAQQSGFMPEFVETDQREAPRQLFQPTQAGFINTIPPEEEPVVPALPPSGLELGTWAELFIDGSWSRYQLTWASPHGTLFMFTNGPGKTHSMTRRLLDKMLQTGTLRVLAGHVVEGALDAVARTAARNSTDIKL